MHEKVCFHADKLPRNDRLYDDHFCNRHTHLLESTGCKIIFCEEFVNVDLGV